jgi:3-oxoacyl-(acyl-carrier-protein) synthase/acyl carrier protein
MYQVFLNDRCGADQIPIRTGVSWLPQYHDFGLCTRLLAMSMGFHLHTMAPWTFIRTPLIWMKTISDQRADFTAAPDFAYALAARKISDEDARTLDVTNCRVWSSGAEPIRASSMEAFALRFGVCGFKEEHFVPSYGLAEHVLGICVGGKRSFQDQMLHVDQKIMATEQRAVVVSPDQMGSKGLFAIAHVTETLESCDFPIFLEIVNPDTLEACTPGRVGEIWADSLSKGSGYWNMPKNSAETFEARIAGRSDGRSYLRTGDLGFILDGNMYICGRAKDLVIVNGKNHYPNDIEASIDDFCASLVRPGCSAVFSVDRPDGTEAMIVCAEVRDERCDFAAVVATIRKAVVAQHQTTFQEVVLLKPRSIPKTTSGKIQRQRCKMAYTDEALSVVFHFIDKKRGELPKPKSAPSEPHNLAGKAVEVVKSGEDASGAADLAEESCPPLSPNADTQDSRWLGLSADQVRLQVDAAVQAAFSNLQSDGKDPAEPFAEMGIDSVTAMEVVHGLGEELQIELSPAALYDHPTIDDLTAHLALRITGGDLSAGAAGPPSSPALAPAVGITGMACRLSGGVVSPSTMWQALMRGESNVTKSPPQRWADVCEAASVPREKRGIWCGAFLDESALASADANQFGLSPAEARTIDIHAKLMLDVATEAISDAQLSPAHMQRCGVFCAANVQEFTKPMPAFQLPRTIAKTLQLTGPCEHFDAACTSSHVAIHRAMQSIRQGQCESAVVVAASLQLQAATSVALYDAGLLSPTGDCCPFDQSGSGLVLGEGCAAIVLQRCETEHSMLSCHALLRGSAVTENSISSGLDLNAPDIAAEGEAIRSALANAGVKKEQVAFVHVHGIGQQVADGAEAFAYRNTLLDPSRPLLLANHKGVFGHTTAVAGILGAITSTLVLKNRLVPTHVGLTAPIKSLSSGKNGSFSIPTAAQPAPLPAESEMFAGLHGHAISGTNVHIIISRSATNSNRFDNWMDAENPPADNSPAPIIPARAELNAVDGSREGVSKVLLEALADVGINLTSLDPAANLADYGISSQKLIFVRRQLMDNLNCDVPLDLLTKSVGQVLDALSSPAATENQIDPMLSECMNPVQKLKADGYETSAACYEFPFETSRLEGVSWLQTFVLLIYVPIGLVLVLLRALLLVSVWSISGLSGVERHFEWILGLSLSTKGAPAAGEKTLFLTNHTTIVDIVLLVLKLRQNARDVRALGHARLSNAPGLAGCAEFGTPQELLDRVDEWAHSESTQDMVLVPSAMTAAVGYLPIAGWIHFVKRPISVQPTHIQITNPFSLPLRTLAESYSFGIFVFLAMPYHTVCIRYSDGFEPTAMTERDARNHARTAWQHMAIETGSTVTPWEDSDKRWLTSGPTSFEPSLLWDPAMILSPAAGIHHICCSVEAIRDQGSSLVQQLNNSIQCGTRVSIVSASGTANGLNGLNVRDCTELKQFEACDLAFTSTLTLPGLDDAKRLVLANPQQQQDMWTAAGLGIPILCTAADDVCAKDPFEEHTIVKSIQQNFANSCVVLLGSLLHYCFMESVIIIIGCVLLGAQNDIGNTLLMFVCVSVSHTITMCIKLSVYRPRPIWRSLSCGIRLFGAAGVQLDGSFPSGHSSFIATLATVAAYEGSSSIAVLMWCATVLTAFVRVLFGAHYPSDVLVGMAIGFGCTAVLFESQLVCAPAVLTADGLMIHNDTAVNTLWDAVAPGQCYLSSDAADDLAHNLWVTAACLGAMATLVCIIMLTARPMDPASIWFMRQQYKTRREQIGVVNKPEPEIGVREIGNMAPFVGMLASVFWVSSAIDVCYRDFGWLPPAEALTGLDQWLRGAEALGGALVMVIAASKLRGVCISKAARALIIAWAFAGVLSWSTIIVRTNARHEYLPMVYFGAVYAAPFVLKLAAMMAAKYTRKATDTSSVDTAINEDGHTVLVKTVIAVRKQKETARTTTVMVTLLLADQSQIELPLHKLIGHGDAWSCPVAISDFLCKHPQCTALNMQTAKRQQAGKLDVNAALAIREPISRADSAAKGAALHQRDTVQVAVASASARLKTPRSARNHSPFVLETPDKGELEPGRGYFGRNEEHFVHDIYPRVHLVLFVMMFVFFLYIGPEHCPNTAGIILFVYLCWSMLRSVVSMPLIGAALRRFSRRSNHGNNKQLWEQKLSQAHYNIRLDEVIHAVAVCAYKEPIGTMRATLDSLSTQSVSANIVIVIAMEARDPTGPETAKQLRKEYAANFPLGFHVTYHQLVPGETAGKHSNENWAARCVKTELMDEQGLDPDCVMMTSCDANTTFHPDYFAHISYAFIAEGLNRSTHIYQGNWNFFPNLREIPTVCAAFYLTLNLISYDYFHNPMYFSGCLCCYTVPMNLAIQCGFWCANKTAQSSYFSLLA